MASELTSDDLVLLGLQSINECPFGFLYFESAPTLGKTHNITVEFIREDSKVLANKVEITF